MYFALKGVVKHTCLAIVANHLEIEDIKIIVNGFNVANALHQERLQLLRQMFVVR